jgi:uncharacterized protein YpbB
MRKTLEKIAKQKKVLSKSVLSAAKQLGLTQDQLAIVLNLDSVETLNVCMKSPPSCYFSAIDSSVAQNNRCADDYV